MESDEEFFEEQAKPRLNMNHGFIHHIRRNQIDRDNYDKKVKNQPKHRKRPKAEKKPENKLYTPPKRDGLDQKSGKSIQQFPRRESGKPLFHLEYISTDGATHCILVKQGHDPSKLAKRLGHQAKIPDELLKTLEWKIEQEQIKRS